MSHRQTLLALEGGGSGPATQDAGSRRELAGDLGASAFVFGDVHVNGDEIRVVAELIDAQSGAALARADARGPRDDLFDLIDQLISGLVQELTGSDELPAEQ